MTFPQIFITTKVTNETRKTAITPLVCLDPGPKRLVWGSILSSIADGSNFVP